MIPAKLTPLLYKTAANGILPIEPMKVKNAAIGPMKVWARICQKAGSSPPDPIKSIWKKLFGTKAAIMPATVKPIATSFQTISHSMT